jgi:hypothetical protein
MGYQGRVYFQDAPQIAGENDIVFIPPQYQPQGDRARRHYPHALRDSRDPTLPLEAAAPGSDFDLHVAYRNLTQAELGLLLLALGRGEPALCPKIGGGKNSGLGAVAFRDVRVTAEDPALLYRQYDSDAAAQEVDVAACLEAAGSLLRDDGALEQLAADLGCDQL